MAGRKITYTEPDDYFPKEIRKEFGLGEYAKPKKEEKAKTPEKKAPAKAKKTK